MKIATDDCESVIVTSRYGDERIFKILDDDTIEYCFKDTDFVRYSSNDDGSLALVDPSGGPYIGVETDLGVVHSSLKGLIVTEIKAAPTIGGVYYIYYLTVKNDNE